MKWTVGLLLTLLLAGPASSQDDLEAYVREQVLSGRYLSDGACAAATTDLFGWSASALQRCVYTVSDGSGRPAKRGVVYLADPPADIVLRWLATACGRIQPSNATRCIRRSAASIRGASGAQFPVAGIVWEDIAHADGIHEAYAFRNGVTVKLAGHANGSSAPIDDAVLEALAVDRAIVGSPKSGGYARIWSTDRASFARYTRRTDIPVGQTDAQSALRWSTIVGDTYRAALAADENPLITAKLCAQLAFPATCGR